MPSWEDVVAMAGELPNVEESTSYRTPSLKVAGKSFARLRTERSAGGTSIDTEAEGGLVLMCSLEEKEALLAAGDPAFYTTPHYDGYGAILVNLEKVDPGQLRELVEEAWRIKAPAKLRKEFDAG